MLNRSSCFETGKLMNEGHTKSPCFSVLSTVRMRFDILACEAV